MELLDRLEQEHADLSGKMLRLENFLDSPHTISLYETQLLKHQLRVMRDYVDILSLRITHHTIKD